jgi:tRNA-2-methylthio-N6-dimethylallyladenosine synthase
MPDREAARRLWKIVAETPKRPRCYIRTFGCQQNVSDSERIAGLMEAAGYAVAPSAESADLIIFNTCAVREHAEDRVFGNVGEIKRLKDANRNLIVALGGCMVQQRHIAEKLLESYPFVDILFNTNELHLLPGHISDFLESGGPVVAIECGEYAVREGLPVKRGGEWRAFIPVMYGCDNFCSYCVVPLVRGRERSRECGDITAEFERAVAEGYKDITLLGQNVNSYGLKGSGGLSFAGLLRRLDALPGDFTIRFMTSHPKDATEELFSAIASCQKVSRHIHLPAQSGSDGILSLMNRGYTAGQYLEKIDSARRLIPGVTFSSDIIVGFPGETEEDFEATAEMVRRVGFSSLFTFIYSPRRGTPAAELRDGVSRAEKARRLRRLAEEQDAISRGILGSLVGKEARVLVTGELPGGLRAARLDSGEEITLAGGCAPNSYVSCRLTGLVKKRLYAELSGPAAG